MSHEVETMAYAGQLPWHGLGKKVRADLTPAQMLTEAQLDWEVGKIPLTYMHNGDQHKSGKQALVRMTDGHQLDVVTDDWNPLQNADAFEFFHDFIMEGGMEMHTAGSLKGGQIVWALAKVSESFELFGGDKVDSYLLFSNPHKFGQAIDVRFTPIRVVCNNTLTLSLKMNSNKMIKVSHRNEFDADMVKEALGVAREKLSTYRETAEFLGGKRYTKKTVEQYFDAVFPSMSYNNDEGTKVSRQALQARLALIEQPGTQYAEGSFWQAFNAVTYLTDHHLGRTADNRMHSAWFGPNQKKKAAALQKAVEFAEAA